MDASRALFAPEPEAALRWVARCSLRVVARSPGESGGDGDLDTSHVPLSLGRAVVGPGIGTPSPGPRLSIAVEQSALSAVVPYRTDRGQTKV